MVLLLLLLQELQVHLIAANWLLLLLFCSPASSAALALVLM